MGLFVLGYLVIVVALGVFCLFCIVRIAVNSKCFEEWSPYAVMLLVSALPFIYLTWPFVVGRLLYESRCFISSGLSVRHSVDATATGYFLSDPNSNDFTGVHYSAHSYARQAFADLTTGRISFFEGYGSYGYGKVEFPYFQVFLADRFNENCIKPYDNLAGIDLPDGKCLAEKRTRTIESKYEVRGFKSHSNEEPTSVSLIDRNSGKTLATYNKFHLNVPLFGSRTCPVEKNSFFSALRSITSVVFPDHEGRTLTQANLDEMETQMSKLGLHTAREIPPHELRAFERKTDANECTAARFGSPFETHKISLYSGGGDAVQSRLDNNTNRVREVSIVVNNPEKRTVLDLHSYDPVVWKIGRTPNSEIAGVVVTGNHGQAVIGISRSTPVMISTEVYAPGENCPRTKMAAVRYALSITASEIKEQSKSFIVIGKPDFQEGSLISSGDRKLEDYAIR